MQKDKYSQSNCERKSCFGLAYDTSDHVCLDPQNCLWSIFEICNRYNIFYIAHGIIALCISDLGLNSSNRYCDTSIIELFAFIGDMDTCPLISQCNTVSINELTLILNCIGKCDVKRNMTLSITTITLVLKILAIMLRPLAPKYL
jgi:hypothetical protein